MIKKLLTFFTVLFALPALATPHLSISGKHILWPNGSEFVGNGFNFNYNHPTGTQNQLKGDVAEAIQDGANVFRIRVPFLNQSVANCGTDFSPTDNSTEEAYDPAFPQFGNINGTWLSLFVQQLDWANAEILASGKPGVIDIVVVGGNCAQNFDPAAQLSQYTSLMLGMLDYLIPTLQNRFGVPIMWEPLAEPVSSPAPYVQTNLQTLQLSMIAKIQGYDPNDPIVIGCSPTYRMAFVTACYLGSGVSGIIYTGDMYDPTYYISQTTPYDQVSPGPAVIVYPGIAKDVFPGGGSFIPPCPYLWKGQTGQAHGNFDIIMDSQWLNSIMGCLVQLRDTNNVPVWVNQFGCKMILPGCLEWHKDVVYFCHHNNIGCTKWVYNQACPNSANCGSTYTFQYGNAVKWQDQYGNYSIDQPLLTIIKQLFNWTEPTSGGHL